MIFTIPALLESTASLSPDRTAIVDEHRRISFRELRHEAMATATVLEDLGIRKGDRVGICMSKSVDQAVAVVGALHANAIVVPVLPRLRPRNVAHIVSDSGMALLITDESRQSELEAVASGTKVVLGSGAGTVDRPSLAVTRKDVVPRDRSCAIGSDTAAIIYSSGSTGRPKGIVISHRNLHDGAKIVSRYLGTRSDDRIAGVLSLNFDYGLNQLWQTILVGCSLHLHELLFPADLFEFIARERVTMLPLMPVMISQMFDRRLYRQTPALDLTSVRCITSSGGRVSEQMLADLRTTFRAAEIYLMYGLTEAFRSTYLPPEQLAYRPTSIGRAIPDVEILVLDPGGRPCPPGEVGELVHRGGCVAKGYWNDPEATARRFRRLDGFPGETLVFSGDLVRTDAEGFIYFVGRADGMIKTRGFRVSPTEVEEVAERYDGVAGCVAFGFDNVEIGQDIVLAYAVREGTEVSEAKYRQFLKSGLPSYMVPRYLVRLATLGTTGNQGKIDRRSAMEEARSHLADR